MQSWADQIESLIALSGYQINAAKIPQSLLEDPEDYAEGMTLKQLTDLIKKAKKRYYNKKKPLFPDSVYDVLEGELEYRDPNHPLLKQVGVEPASRGKVELPFYMPSLDKLKNQTQLERWGQRFDSDFIVSDKIDGVSLLVVSNKGNYSLYTRGNGKVGQDVSHLAQIMKLPKTRSSFAVRAELVMPAQTFKGKYAKQAENPRNFVSGLVNRKGGSGELKDSHLLAYELIKPGPFTPDEQFKKMKALGFRTAPHRRVKNLQEAALLQLSANQRKKSGYEIDGLVITPNIKYRRVSAGNPDYSVAFKSTSMNPDTLATVIKVEWNLSKNGYLKPRVQIKPVKLGGVTIQWATGFNFRFIKDNKIGPGAKVKLIRSGDVIPKITEVVQPARKPQLPTEKYTLTPTGIDAILKDQGGQVHNEIKIRRILFFLATMGIEGFKRGTVERLMDNGWENEIDFIHTNVEDLLEVPGFQQRGATKLVNNIDKVFWNSGGVDLVTLMTATGLFGRGIGKSRLEILVNAIPDIMSKTPRQVQTVLNGLSGFSLPTITKIVDGLQPFKEFVKEADIEIKKPAKRKKQKGGNKLDGHAIVFTGFRSAELQQLIESQGGKVQSGVRSDTTLVVYRGARISGKIKAAQNKGIQTMPETEFLDWIKKRIK